MVKVITYGTYDLLHYGHIRLLERAKALGDYLIVGVTSDSFDIARGKINVQQPLMERIEAVKETGLADEIIVEEYEGQKIDDIRRYGVDIFTVGSDWKGKFDYLNEYCKVVYLDRTIGVSSSEIRTEERLVSIGIAGDYAAVMDKFVRESAYVNGVKIGGLCVGKQMPLTDRLKGIPFRTEDYGQLLDRVDAVYLVSHPEEHYGQIRQALEQRKHVICESPLAVREQECRELFELARRNGCILMESNKTAYALAFDRLRLLTKSGVIGDLVSVDVTCTSLQSNRDAKKTGARPWGSLCLWGPHALLAVFALLGTDYVRKSIQTRIAEESYDLFTKVSFVYENAVASLKVGNGVKSEGDAVISGTKGYVYIPAPWWKTDYFEVRFEDPQENRRCFYQLEGEGIRYMIVSFLKSICDGKDRSYISEDITCAISRIMEDFADLTDTEKI